VTFRTMPEIHKTDISDSVFHWKTMSHPAPLLNDSIIFINLTGLLLCYCPYHFNALQYVGLSVKTRRSF
jgi:hypothetical protein